MTDMTKFLVTDEAWTEVAAAKANVMIDLVAPSACRGLLVRVADVEPADIDGVMLDIHRRTIGFSPLEAGDNVYVRSVSGSGAVWVVSN